MKKNILIILMLFFGFSASGQTKEEIITRHFQKMGASDKWIAINTFKREGTNILGKSLTDSKISKVAHFYKKNALSKIELRRTIDGNENIIIVASDALGTWNKINNADVQRLSKYGIQFGQTDMTIFLANELKNKDNVQLKPKETIDGKEYYVLDVKNDKMRRILYLDTKTYMIYGYQSANYKDGSKEQSITYTSDYKSVNGLLFPFLLDVNMMGMPTKTIVKSIQINIPIDDKIFSPEKE